MWTCEDLGSPLPCGGGSEAASARPPCRLVLCVGAFPASLQFLSSCLVCASSSWSLSNYGWEPARRRCIQRTAFCQRPWSGAWARRRRSPPAPRPPASSCPWGLVRVSPARSRNRWICPHCAQTSSPVDASYDPPTQGEFAGELSRGAARVKGDAWWKPPGPN